MYEEFYHLSAKPFRLSPDPGFFFPSRGHKRALAYLRYGLSQDEGFVVITGAPGTGKTTLAQILLKEMDQSDLVVAHLTTTQLEADEMLRMVAAAFGLRYDGVNKAGLLKTMEAFLLARSRERKRVLLVIDEAQNLPPESLEELRMLSNLQVGDKALVQTFLLGQAQFRHMLDHPDLEQLRQRVIANYHLSELAEDECQSYIETRLHHVGWVDDPTFTTDAYRGIYEYTQGIPRRINMLCDRLMLFGCLEERHEIDKAVLREVTEELQQEISGVPLQIGDESDDTDNLNEVLDTHSESVIEELETQDQQSAYSQNQASTDENTIQTVLEDNSMDKVVPEEGYENINVQAQLDEAEINDESGENRNHGVTHNNKDRFQVISGGRSDFRGGQEPVSTEPLRPANNLPADVRAPVPDAPGDSEEVVLRKILRLVLAYHRSPRSFPGLDDPSQPLPKGITQILSLAVSEDEVVKNLRQIAVMGISPAMLRAAVRFFVRRVLFLPGGDDFRVLGLSEEANKGQVEEHYGLLMRLMRQEKKSTEESGVHRIGEAYERLCQGEITHVPEEPLEEDNIADIEDLEELDLDLAPNLGNLGAESSVARSTTVDTANVIESDQRTGPTSRNILLIASAAVVMFVLYLTQISTTTVDVAPDTGVDMAITQDTQAVQEQTGQFPESSVIDGELQVSDQALQAEQVEPGQERVQAVENDVEAEDRRQSILAELRAKSKNEEIERAKQETMEQERARLEAELRKANQAKAEAEARARREAQARAQAEAQARAAAAAKAEAEAKAAAALKANQEKAEAQAQQVAVANSDVESPASKSESDPGSDSAASKATTASTGKLQASDANVIISQLEKAYTEGDLDKLVSLFSKSARTNNNTDISGVRSEYKKVFEDTISRSIQLKNIAWSVDFDTARGSGDYEQLLTTSGAASKTQTMGEVLVQLERKAGQLRIARLYYGDPVSISQLPLDTSARAPEVELNRVLANFVRSYNAGEVDPFIELFSPNARTNDRDNLQGIREDYVGLFSSTSMRKMTLNNMQWAWREGVAESEGNFIVEVQANGQSETETFRGKLWFHIVQSGDELKIAYFEFSTE